MIQFVCSKCPAGYSVHGTWFKIQELLVANPMWRDKDKSCPLCGEVLLLHALKLREPNRKWRRIDVEAFFRALCGFGLPEELGCSPEAISSLILANPIVGIDMAAAGGDRTVVYTINLKNNTKLHLAASPEGPCIYKITRMGNGHSNCNDIQKKTADSSVQRPHQGVQAEGEKADFDPRVSDVGADINGEDSGGVAPTGAGIQTGSDLDASHSVGASAGGSSSASSAQVTT